MERRRGKGALMKEIYDKILEVMEREEILIMADLIRAVRAEVGGAWKQVEVQIMRAVKEYHDLEMFRPWDYTSKLGKGINRAFKRLYGISISKALALKVGVVHNTTEIAFILSLEFAKKPYRKIAEAIRDKYFPELTPVLPRALQETLDFMKTRVCEWLSARDVADALGITYGAAFGRLSRLHELDRIKRYTTWIVRPYIRRVWWHYVEQETSPNGGGLPIHALMTMNSKVAEDLIREVMTELGAWVWPREKRVGHHKFDLWGEVKGVPFAGSLKLYDEPVTSDRAEKDLKRAARRLRRLFAFYTRPSKKAARLVQEAGGVLIRVPYVLAYESEKLKHYLKLKGTKFVSPGQFKRILRRKLKKVML